MNLSVRSSFNAPSIEIRRMGGTILRDTSDLRKKVETGESSASDQDDSGPRGDQDIKK